MKKTFKQRYFRHSQIIAYLMTGYDIATFVFAYGLCLWLRFDCQFSKIPVDYYMAYFKFMPIYIIFSLVMFLLFKMYRSVWRFVSYVELQKSLIVTLICGAFHAAAITVLFNRMPVTYYVFGPFVQFLMSIGIRFSYRFVLLLRNARNRQNNEEGRRIMLIGAGAAGEVILRDISQCDKSRDHVVCIIDDNVNKHSRYIDGVPIVGGRDCILKAAKDYRVDRIYLCIPSASTADKRDILNICKETGCDLRNLPGVYQLTGGKITASSLEEVKVEDLLGRDPIKVDLTDIFGRLQDKTILITGGGGSIGSELARQIAAHKPGRLILFDIYENNVYDIQQELKKRYPELELVVLIGSVRDSRRLMQVFDTYRPQVVFHAAAHKHVPLMEDSPCESIKNNVVGTYKTAYIAAAHRVERFVLISTDKAVNPTNIMGASKRLCEMIIQSFDYMLRSGRASDLPMLFTHAEATSMFLNIPGDAKTEYVAVRFGNVLGSNGSVIPLFKRQIEQGGPVTVTHPDIIRYFMTIPEAVSLVLQAGTYARGGEIFVLDMGDPVKIDDLARNLIKLSGLKPDVDIMIEYTGLRPGEKLYEEKLMAEEGLKTTPNKLIHIGCPIPFGYDSFLENLQELMDRAYDNDPQIRLMVQDMVSTYHPAN